MKPIKDRKKLFLINTLFVLGATLLFWGIALLVDAGLLPIVKDASIKSPRLITIWFGLYALLFLAAIPITLLIFIKKAAVRLAFAPIFFILLIQIGSELLLRQIFFAQIAVLISITYIIYRLWQLNQAWISIKGAEDLSHGAEKYLSGLIIGGVMFCIIEILLFTGYYLPKMIAA